MKLACLLTLVFFFAVSSFVLAQEKSSYKFSSVVVSDFTPKYYSIDSNATAVILAVVGSTG